MFVNVSQRLYSTEPKRLKTTSQVVTLQIVNFFVTLIHTMAELY